MPAKNFLLGPNPAFRFKIFLELFFSMTIKELPLVALFGQEKKKSSRKMLSTAIWGNDYFRQKTLVLFFFIIIFILMLYGM
jgi:hypothetical protein